MKYIKINDWVIKTTDKPLTGSKEDVYILGFDGLFSTGESDVSSYDKSYSNGSILATPRYRGKNFSIDIGFIGENKIDNLKSFINMVLENNVLVSIDNYKDYQCITTKIQERSSDLKYITITIHFSTNDYK